ncbi:transposase family protein [Paraburkholderia sediminicola]|uniref:integrase catalytic domain-containing protein n=1 Tax=Paraburkholderia sediminicola TaxID=458836 RepID=UPI0038B8C3E0
MLSDNEFDKYAARTGLTGNPFVFVEEIRRRKAEPVIGNSQRENSLVFVTSRKMAGRQIRTRSRSLHASAVKWHEFNPAVAEYYLNAHTFDLTSRDDTGKVRNRQSHTVQLLVLADDEPYFEDWREEKDLTEAERRDAERHVKMSRYHRDELGRWHDRLLEDACGQIGLKHRLRTSSDIPRTFVENMRVLEDYLDDRNPLLATDIIADLREMVSKEPVRYLDLLDKDGLSADLLLSAIATGIVYVDLSCVQVRDLDQLILFRDEGMSRAHASLVEGVLPQEAVPLPGVGALQLGMTIRYNDQNWELIHQRLDDTAEVLFRTADGRQIVMPRHEALQLLVAQQDHCERKLTLQAEKRRSLADFSSDALKLAASKLAAVRDGSDGFSASTLSRAKRVVRGAASTIDALITLAGRHADKGHRGPRLPAAVDRLATECIVKHYNSPPAPSARQVHDKFVERCVATGLSPMSYVTFLKRVKDHVSLRDRQGKRVAYRDSDIPLILDIREPIHGLFPHEVVYIDHTLVNLMTAGPNREDWGKIWITAAVDGHVPVTRALYQSYDPPSAWSALMVLRDYVRRWRRLPRVVVVDGGKEFRSHAFRIFCQIFGIDIRYRGPGRPRGGAPVERMFGVTEQELIGGLEGSSIQLKDARMTTKSVSPNQFRIWTFPVFCRALEHYLFKVRPLAVHTRLGVSPQDFEHMRLQQTGFRLHTTVEFDENLLLLTCPSPPQPSHRVYPHRGIWESGHYYWHSDFSRLAGKKLEVRIEPWKASILYINTGSKWIVATARNVDPLKGRTRYEVIQAQRAQQIFARLAAERDRRKPERATRLVEARDPLNFDLTIATKQEVMVGYYRSLNMGIAKFDEMERSDSPKIPEVPGCEPPDEGGVWAADEAKGDFSSSTLVVADELRAMSEELGGCDDETALI